MKENGIKKQHTQALEMYCSICEFVYKYSKFYKIFSNVMPHCIIEDLHFNNPIT